MYGLYCILSILSIIMINQKENKDKQNLGSSLSLPAYGRAGQGQHSLAAYFAKRNTKNCGGEKRSGESEGGQKFLVDVHSPTPFLFARPSLKVFQNSISGFSSKKVRILTKRHRSWAGSSKNC